MAILAIPVIAATVVIPVPEFPVIPATREPNIPGRAHGLLILIM